jgi:hypothetical protein
MRRHRRRVVESLRTGAHEVGGVGPFSMWACGASLGGIAKGSAIAENGSMSMQMVAMSEKEKRCIKWSLPMRYELAI